MDDPSPAPENRRLVEATAWRARLSESGQAHSAELEAWLKEDPANREAWQSTETLWNLLGEQSKAPEFIEMRKRALEAAKTAEPSRFAFTRATTSGKLNVKALMTAAGIFALIAAALWYFKPA